MWADTAAGVALGHTRLAIIDLSETGRQPMRSACGRYQMVFNGEIYNHLELRRRLHGQEWRGHSDTETLLACIAAWGIDKTLKAVVGMFALAVFDCAEHRLILARDRFGEKPLYFGYSGASLLFASGLRAFRVVPSFERRLDPHAVTKYMRYGYVPTPLSIYESIRKLEPGTWIEVGRTAVASRRLPERQQYWSAVEVATEGQARPLALSDDEAIEELHRVLERAVQSQMMADVPLGAFLSGGIDSSTVVALMQASSMSPVRTFSIGFEEGDYDESLHARRVAEHLGTDHTDLTVTAKDAAATIPGLAKIYDEPFADSSQLPTFLVAQLARTKVSVALSGDGGDELFGGYNRYFLGARAWPRVSRLPVLLRQAIAMGLRTVPLTAWNRLGALTRPVLPQRYHLRVLGDKVYKAADALESRTAKEFYDRLVSQFWREAASPATMDADGSDSWPHVPGFIHQMMVVDALTYLPDDILTKVDRAAMAVSLETRVPLLDHRVFAFAWQLPLTMKVRNGEGKWLLRQLLYRLVPRDLVERPKAGFGVPLGSWLRGALREWAEHLLEEQALSADGLDARAIRRRWQEHVSGKRDWQYSLWAVLMFRAWSDENL